ncbi:matrixin family metalloprotease [Bradyrhizobium sp. OK095]|jgi:hypothetical protein|uniref:matrixin family metalloprotease n=1 Tax=Bradyrhizobium sp. OK095 TaxID=1882760 RepID=UPI0008AB0086|nr:matrixin family metalloprotease [Bradyrhizobium sp. OK095]SEM70964.1 Matrixin [Bradyrhizobium sp. OK095]
MSRAPKKSKTSKASTSKTHQPGNPFALSGKSRDKPSAHEVMTGVRCDTEGLGHHTPRGRSPLEIVVDASEGFIPLWAKDTTLRWRFRDRSFAHFASPSAAKASVEQLVAKAILAWGDAAPVKFAKRDDSWDFEIVMKAADDCDGGGCVLASAFFPDAGRHKLLVYPRLFQQSPEEQVETLIHEIGHAFGLRHFFALVSETSFPAEVFGTHSKFSIMNYGPDSKLTADDRLDLKRLYQQAWNGQLTHINGTPIRFVKPYHDSGTAAESPVALAAMRTIVTPYREPR